MIEDYLPRLPGNQAASRADAWQQLMRDQYGLLDIDQLQLLGIGPGAVAANLKAQRWRRVLPRVYATFTGPLTRAAQITAALLYGGPQAVLSHRTAAEEWRMLRIGPLAPVHITVPYPCSAVSQPPYVVVHRSRAFPHLVVGTEPPRTSRADTVLDLATSEPDARAAMRRFVALATTGRVPVRELRWRLEQRRPRRYGVALADALRLLAEGVQSALEQRYACVVEMAHCLPVAQRQRPFVVDGRTLWEDVSYDPIGIPLTVRLDGRAFHDAPEVAFRDRRRDNVAELAARHRLVYGWDEVTRDPCGVATEVAAVLHRAGWHGPLRQCSDGCAPKPNQIASPYESRMTRCSPRSLRLSVDAKGRSPEMHEFQCGHQECGSGFTASSKDHLMAQVAEHLKEAHNVDKATQTLMSYLEATCVTTRQPS